MLRRSPVETHESGNSAERCTTENSAERCTTRTEEGSAGESERISMGADVRSGPDLTGAISRLSQSGGGSIAPVDFLTPLEGLALDAPGRETPRPPPPGGGGLLHPWGWLGARASEAKSLAAHTLAVLRHARTGGSRGVLGGLLLCGPRGVGKSSLVREVGHWLAGGAGGCGAPPPAVGVRLRRHRGWRRKA